MKLLCIKNTLLSHDLNQKLYWKYLKSKNRNLQNSKTVFQKGVQNMEGH